MHVLITGANRGIGAALADAYRAAGDTVTATSRDGTAGALLDVTDRAQCQALADGLDGRPLDLLICNAGVYLDKGQDPSGYPPEMWAQTFAANVTGVFLTVQALLPNLRLSGGKVAIIASQMGSSERSRGGSYVYRASKAAAVNLGRNLAVDLAADGIPVGIYHPGWVRTDMGGTAADISTDQSVSGLMQRFAALSAETSGCFEAWDGARMPF